MIEARQPFGVDKELLAIRAMVHYSGLVDVLGFEEASREMGLALGGHVLAGEINRFEADLIGTLAILGYVATNVMNENGRLRDGTPETLGE